MIWDKFLMFLDLNVVSTHQGFGLIIKWLKAVKSFLGHLAYGKYPYYI